MRAWPDERCQDCPCPDPPCLAQRLGNATLCRYAADGHDGYRALLARPAGEAAPAPAPLAGPAGLPLAGDLVAAAARRIGADRLAAWVASKTGQPCNCPARREALNRLDASLRRWLRMGR